MDSNRFRDDSKPAGGRCFHHCKVEFRVLLNKLV